jgi:hypothetical protein
MITDCHKLNECLDQGQDILEAVSVECSFCDDQDCGSNLRKLEERK